MVWWTLPDWQVHSKPIVDRLKKNIPYLYKTCTFCQLTMDMMSRPDDNARQTEHNAIITYIYLHQI